MLCGKKASKNLLHCGSGGFDSDGATCGYGNRGDVQAEHDRFIGRPPIGNKIVPAKHADIIAGSVPVIVLGSRRAGINTGRVGGESKISIGKVGKKRIGIKVVE